MQRLRDGALIDVSEDEYKGRKERDQRVAGEAIILGGVERMRWRARARRGTEEFGWDGLLIVGGNDHEHPQTYFL